MDQLHSDGSGVLREVIKSLQQGIDVRVVDSAGIVEVVEDQLYFALSESLLVGGSSDFFLVV